MSLSLFGLRQNSKNALTAAALLVPASLDRIRQELIELGTRHLQLVRMRIDVFGKALEFGRLSNRLRTRRRSSLAIELEIERPSG